MTTFVGVDASVALKWVLNAPVEANVEQAQALLHDTLIQRGVFIVPPHFFAEITNVLYHRIQTNRPEHRLTRGEAEEALATLRRLPIEPAQPPDLYERALDLAQQHKLAGAYDALYLAAAEAAGCDLWTDDQRLLKALDGALPYVKWVHDYDNDPERTRQV